MTLYEVLMTEDIDESIRDVLIKLNMAGYDTKYSCSGAPRDHNVGRKITDTKECADYLLSIGQEHMAEWVDGARCYLVLMVNDKRRNLYIKELREKLHGTNWYVGYTNIRWKRWEDKKCWHYLKNDFSFEDRITLEYKCEFSNNACRKAWNSLLERLLRNGEIYNG